MYKEDGMRFKLILCSLIVLITAPTTEASLSTPKTKKIKAGKAKLNQPRTFEERDTAEVSSAPASPSPSHSSLSKTYSDMRQELCRKDKAHKRKKRWNKSVADSQIRESLEEHQDSKTEHVAQRFPSNSPVSKTEVESYSSSFASECAYNSSSSDDEFSEDFTQDRPNESVAAKHIPLPTLDDDVAESSPRKIPMTPVKKGSYHERYWENEARINPDKYEFSEQTPWMIIKSGRPDDDDPSSVQ